MKSQFSVKSFTNPSGEKVYRVYGLEDWLRNGFFDQHCKLFHQRPFIWQIWDGRKDGFSSFFAFFEPFRCYPAAWQVPGITADDC